MKATSDDISALKCSIDLVELVQGKGVSLKKQGKSFVGLCPFHKDTKPSFSVDSDKKIWHCFGCNKGGDVFSFLQELEGLSFAQALEQLGGARGGGTLSEGRSSNVQKILTRVIEFYHQTFYDDPRGLEYLRDTRHIHDKEIYETFMAGFANGSIFSMLPSSGDIFETLKKIGIITAQGREFFHHHVVFPIANEDGQAVGIYGRSIEHDAHPPHLYLKGPHQGVFNWQAAKRSRDLFVTEGIIDALSLYQAGFRDVISLYGVNGLTQDHIDLFKKHRTTKLFLVLDNDAAGEEACLRIAETLSPVECFRVALPCKDANDFFRDHGKEELAALIDQAPPVAGSAPERAFTQEKLDDGFSCMCDDIAYRVKVIPSYDGRLRVTLRASCHEKVFLDTFDLYSHRSRQAAVNQLVKRFGVKKEQCETHFFHLITEAERFEDEERAEGAPDKKDLEPSMTDDERVEALSFLTSPRLIDELLSDLELLGYVGEDSNKLLAYLIGISRKLDRPLSGILSSSSGAGKSRLAEMIESLTPPEDVILFSRLSPQALGYMEKDFLKQKLLIIEERCGSEAADYSIRTLQTRRKLTQGVVIKDPSTGKMYTKTYTVEGPIAYLETTTSGAVNPENSTRCFELSLDESREQTKKVHRTQRHSRTIDGLLRGDQAEALRKKHQNAQRLLKPLNVVIPYAPKLEFPSEWLRTRRDNERFLCLIEAVSFIHQHQREQKTIYENGKTLAYIEATLEDYRCAYELAKEVLSHTLHDLKKNSKELLEEIVAMASEKAEAAKKMPQDIIMSRRDIREHTKWSDWKVRDCLSQLVDLEYLRVVSGSLSQGKVCFYQLPEELPDIGFSLRGLTTPEELEVKL